MPVTPFDNEVPEGEYVYHYTRASTAIDYILGPMKLRANVASAMNDPLESNPYRHNAGGFGWEGVVDLKETHNTLMDFEKRTFSQKVILCSSLDKFPKPLIPDVCKINDRGFAKPTMWAHYADCHRGVCLVLRKEELDASVTGAAGSHDVESQKVDYVSLTDRPRIDADQIASRSYLEDYETKNFNLIYFTKHKDWACENEFRWIVFGVSEPLLINIESSLVGIVLGQSFDWPMLDSLRTVSRGIEMRYLDWVSGKARLHML